MLKIVFKHGSIKEGKLSIKIDIKTQGDILFFELINSSVSKNEKSTGIGLENLKKRLEMLYPDKHDLTIDQAKNTHQIKLKISGLK